MTRRPALHLLALMLLAWGPTGCEGIDWNWEAAWWKRPRRIVRPQRPADHAPRRSRTAPREEPRSAERAPVAPEPAAAPVARARARPPEPRVRAFYRLYLLSGGQAGAATRGEARLPLEHVDARACAALLEMLFVPVGRSGSPEETYLIYEQQEEFDAARRFAPTLDVPPGAEAPPRDPLRAGIACFLRIVNAGAIVDPALIDRCERNLAEAAHAPQTPAPARWAAALLAGRLLAEYRYDYAGARSYFNQARRCVPAGSVEAMTADWWRADALAQSGRTADAHTAFERLIDNYAARWPRARIVARSAALVENQRAQR